MDYNPLIYYLCHIRTLPEYDRDTKNKKTSYKVSALEALPPLTIYNRARPKFPADASFISPPENIFEFNMCLLKYFVWLLCRWLSTNDDQGGPSVGRFISSIVSVS